MIMPLTISKGPRTESTKGDDWRELSACSDPRHDPELWFPLGDTGPSRVQTAIAKQICWGECPVRRECLSWANSNKHISGIWGGQTEQERRAR